MLKKEFCICRCYYNKNLYLKDYGLHCVYKNSSQFCEQYSEILTFKGCKNIEEAEEKVLEEINRRKHELKDTVERRKIITKSYKPLHQSLFTFSDKFFQSSFLKLCSDVQNSDLDSNSVIKQHGGNLICFPVFTNEFCNKFIEEIKHFEESDLPKRRPNTMNRYGVNVDEIGFEPLINQLRTKYLFPLSQYFFPEWTGPFLDSHRAFVVKYKVGEDVDLSYHYDNAEVTLNVSLNDDYVDGDLFFGPMRQEDSAVKFGHEHKKGEGVLHKGQQMHGAFPITEGERYNLIIWMRSSFIRNQCCPMCDELPDLEPVLEGTGDGFTTEIHDVCSVV